MKIIVNHAELLQVEALLPESAKMLIHVLGYATTARLINRFGGVSLAAKSGERKEQTGFFLPCYVMNLPRRKSRN